MNINGLRRALGLGAVVLAGTSAQAITFFDVSYSVSPLTANANEVVIGNSISFHTPHAVVGDSGTGGARDGEFQIQYRADAGVGIEAIEMGITLHEVILGSMSTIDFKETVYELLPDDTLGEIVGAASESFFANFVGSWSQTLVLTRSVQRVHVVKNFYLSAPMTDDLDFTSLALVNQNLQVVPEPATMAALGIGALGLLRRRRNH